jgi:hypothetical protein
MIGGIAVFGIGLSLDVILVVTALVVGLALVVLASLTLGLSVLRSVRERRRERVREELQDRLLERVFDPETDWDEWVAGLSSVERDVVETLLDEYIRELDGQSVANLQALGEALDIPERSESRLESGSEYDRLYALTWLALLDRPDRVRAAGFEPETVRERVAVARLRHESNDLEDAREGITIVLAETTAQLSVFGQDTLYQIALEDPGALLEIAADTYQTWSEPLLVQVLVVCRHMGSNVGTEDISWLTAALEHEREPVRAAAALALGNVGWRRDLRNAALVDRLVADPAPRVREAVYRMLARWGDQQAIEALGDALRTEGDPRARLAGTKALARQRDRFPGETTEPLERAWQWSREHVEYDRTARRQNQAVSR